MLLRDALIAIHAIAGLVAFAAGVVAVMPSRSADDKRRWFSVFAVSLGVMIVFVVAAVAVDWVTLATTQRIVFSVLLGLAFYMGVRARSASVTLRAHPEGRQRPYLEHMGFVLISLFEGLVIVAAIDSNAPGILVVLIGGAGVMAGAALLGRLESRAEHFRPPRAVPRPH